MSGARSTTIDRWLKTVRVDFAPEHRQASRRRVGAATTLSIGGSLLADAVLVVIGTAVFPGTKGYVHSNSTTTPS